MNERLARRLINFVIAERVENMQPVSESLRLLEEGIQTGDC